MYVRKWAGAHSQCFYSWKVCLIINGKGQEHSNGPAYQKQSSVSLPFLKTYALFQEKPLNGKSLTFQKLTKKYISFLAGDINLVKVSL